MNVFFTMTCLSSLTFTTSSWAQEQRVRRFTLEWSTSNPLKVIYIPFANKGILTGSGTITNYDKQLDSAGYDFSRAEKGIVARPQLPSDCEIGKSMVTVTNSNNQSAMASINLMLSGAGCQSLEQNIRREPLIIKFYGVPAAKGQPWDGVELRWSNLPFLN